LTTGRKKLRTTVGLLTGHCGLRKHLYLLRLSTEANCRFCKEEEETPIHLMRDCKPLAGKGMVWFFSHIPEPDDIASQPLTQILNFFISLGVIEEQ
jgi:hypothetical protein